MLIITPIITEIKNGTKGEIIRTVEEVINAADEGKSLYYRGGRTPAAFIQNFQARHLVNEINAGVLFYYISKQK